MPQQLLPPSRHPVQGDLLDSHPPGHRHGIRPRRRHVPICEEEQRLEGAPVVSVTHTGEAGCPVGIGNSCSADIAVNCLHDCSL